VLLGLGGMLLFRTPKPAPQPVVEAPKPAPTPGPAQRSLHVESVPSGAHVSYQGQPLGQTPLDTRIAAGDSPPQLSLEADGYQPASVTAQLQGDALVATAKLVAVAPRPAPTPTITPTPVPSPHANRPHKKGSTSSNSTSAPSGYKDDPYK
jgi:hypothetical protein